MSTRTSSETGTPLIDAEREAELLARAAEAANAGPLSERAVQASFRGGARRDEAGAARGRPRPPSRRPRRPVAAAVASLAVVGTGLLGTSSPSPRSGPASARVTGWDADAATLREAAGAKALDDAAGSLADAVAGVELVVVAVPVGALVATTRDVLAAVAAGRDRHRRRLDEARRSPQAIDDERLRARPSARRRRDRRARARRRRPLRRRDLVPDAAAGERGRRASSSSSGSSPRSARARSGSTPRPTTGCSP